MSRYAAAQKYQGFLFEALQAAGKSLSGSLKAEVILRPLSRSIIESWKLQWVANIRQPPNGGWDWEQAYNMCGDEPSRFGVAIFVGERLCGLALLRLNNTAVVVELIERDPRDDCPLKGQVLLTTLQAATCYGQKAGREELWLCEPVEGMLPIYLEVYGFSLETPPSGKPYCRRRIP